MGFWKDVSLDMFRGMSKDSAIKYNAQLRYGNLSKEEQDKLIAEKEAEIVINSME